MCIVPQGEQFSLSPNGFKLLNSPGFIAYVNQEWDALENSHPCYRADSGLCMATLWDRYENLNGDKYPDA
jgi:hypothetical protein